MKNCRLPLFALRQIIGFSSEYHFSVLVLLPEKHAITFRSGDRFTFHGAIVIKTSSPESEQGLCTHCCSMPGLWGTPPEHLRASCQYLWRKLCICPSHQGSLCYNQLLVFFLNHSILIQVKFFNLMHFWGNSENYGISTEEIYLPVPLRRGKVVALPRETKPFIQYMVTIPLKFA